MDYILAGKLMMQVFFQRILVACMNDALILYAFVLYFAAYRAQSLRWITCASDLHVAGDRIAHDVHITVFGVLVQYWQAIVNAGAKRIQRVIPRQRTRPEFRLHVLGSVVHGLNDWTGRVVNYLNNRGNRIVHNSKGRGKRRRDDYANRAHNPTNLGAFGSAVCRALSRVNGSFRVDLSVLMNAAHSSAESANGATDYCTSYCSN